MLEPGWYAFTSDEDRVQDDRTQERPRAGAVITLMADDSIDVPLWDEDGTLLFADRAELIGEWQVSEELADEIIAWARAHVDQVGHNLDAEAARLIDRLRQETEYRFRIVHKA